ncbi:MAG: Gfo/Idh/MocA family oxidoreductase [Candidatus Eisenbacteria bacterium]|uniref:Gfo/Idh/MocA family oxidoreductase n=1 Tax=Eiseniibacteriota bacterium TaxID=2212470 RepID=A0A9D6QK53_UNCEI|nr:Gfo/Idh/MocA family oxidoreductase [Candidatus Eisenbacteria bacterium]MBI3539945.1 Gfo/Idh/MocA family oxidoreductase [Candidatus Eisenbacteria bacterium]
MGETVGIAVVGTGDWGANLVRNFAALPGSRLAALCDTDPARLARAAAQAPGARTTTRLEEIAAAPDVRGVVVAASAIQHHPIAKALLEAGKDVYVEKPLALTVGDAEELVRLARERDRILMVGHLLLYHPGVRHLKEMVRRGDLGDILYIYSQRVNLGKVRRDENALWSFAPHDLSVILHLLEMEPVDVAARGAAFLQGEVEDVVFLHLRFADGRMAHVHVSWLDPHKLRKFTVVGRQKMVVFDDMEASEKIRVYDKGVDRAGQIVSYGDALSIRSGDILIPKISLQEPLRLECQHFVECVRDHKAPLTDGADGLRVVRVLAAAQRSLELGGAPVALAAETAAAR